MSKEIKVNICRDSFLHALGVAVYVFAVINILQNGDKWFGQMDNVWSGFAFLMLFVLSAGVCGILIFGRPVMLFLDNFKKEAISFLVATLGWLLLLVIITLGILAVL